MEIGWEGFEEGEKGEVESVCVNVVVNVGGFGLVSLCEGVVFEVELVELWFVKGKYVLLWNEVKIKVIICFIRDLVLVMFWDWFIFV